jgi:hypothetical protein
MFCKALRARIKALTHHNKELQIDTKGPEIEVDTMTGEKTSTLHEFEGEEIIKKVSALGSIKISSHETASALVHEEKFGRVFITPNIRLATLKSKTAAISWGFRFKHQSGFSL